MRRLGMPSLRLGHQLGFAVGGLLVLVGALSGWNLLVTRQLTDAHRSLVDSGIPAVRLEVELLEHLAAMRRMEGRYAILGKHDMKHDPERVRKELSAAGYAVLVNSWREATVRGVRCVLVGHEGPWFRPGPDLSDAPPDLFRLDLGPDAGHWLTVAVVGTLSHRNAIGARVTVAAGGRTFADEVRGGGSYYAQNDFRLHFGLGRASKVDLVEIAWPSGLKENVRDVPVNHLIVVEESKGIVNRRPFERSRQR